MPVATQETPQSPTFKDIGYRAVMQLAEAKRQLSEHTDSLKALQSDHEKLQVSLRSLLWGVCTN